VKNGMFSKDLLPSPEYYYSDQGLVLLGSGVWRSAVCPFHDDNKPSLRISTETGGFCCMACGEKGGDVLDFHRRKYQLSFIQAAKALGAWGVDR